MFVGAFLLATASDSSAQGSRLSVVHAFTGPDGAFSSSSLTRGTDGNFYGTTEAGGASNLGTVFRMTPGGAITVLHSFPGIPFGDSPRAGLIQANDGNFYGTTALGGTFGLGTVFRMTPGGTVTIIRSFGPAPDGANPRASLIQGSDGNLYGTTEKGGNRSRGTLFQMSLAGARGFEYSFSGAADGAFPKGPVIQARNGALYGTVYAGDFSTLGRVFVLAGSTVTVVHTFLGGANDGANPETALVEGTDGFFYGTTRFGGSFNQGTAFRMTPTGAVTVIKSFSGGEDGANPDTALIQPRDGNFYGATRIGGIGYGTLFKMNPAGVVTTLHTFSGGGNGANPGAALVEGPGGTLLGTTVFGGSGSAGVVYRLRTTLAGAAPGDFDGDGRADQTVFRPSTGHWFTNNSSGGPFTDTAWGNSSDVLVPGDYDGDGQIDHAVFRPSTGTWHILNSGSVTVTSFPWGNAADKPVPADYDGDGLTDIAIFRPSTGTWHIVNSSTGGAVAIQWGNGADVPLPGDYNGDGKRDVAVFRPSTGTWFVLYTGTSTVASVQWGNGNDIPVPGDYDGDGRIDAAVFRPSTGTWFILNSSNGTVTSLAWGNSADKPVPGDYDGDGRTDIAVFRPGTGTWFIVNSGSGTVTGVQWGNASDIPILRRP